MIVGTGFAHTFSIASSGTGTAAFGPVTVLVGLVTCAVIGFTMREVRGKIKNDCDDHN